MKLLIMSDSHGRGENLERMILDHPDVNGIIFLGDGERDFDEALENCGIDLHSPVITCQVRGNCDGFSTEPELVVREFGGVRFLVTHGHRQNVKCGRWDLIEEAKRLNCGAALFGHTHVKHFSEKEGITLINPGSVADGNFLVLEVKDGRITLLEK